MKKFITIEKLNYAQYRISTAIGGEIQSAIITGSHWIDEYNGSDNWHDSEAREERAADELYDIIYKANAHLIN